MANAYILNIKYPVDGQPLAIRFEPNFIEHLFKYHPVQFENLRVVKAVLLNPKRIFIGIKRAVSADGLCFVGQPENWHVRENKYLPFPKERLVFVVYLNDRNSVYEFRAEEVDFEDPLSPKDWKNRFGGLLWKSTS